MLFTPDPSVSRRHVLAGAALSSLSLPQRLSSATLEDASFLDGVLRSSSVYAVKVDPSPRSLPSATLSSANRLVRALESKRAVFLGEHHSDRQDHLLQAALLRRLLLKQAAARRPLAVGLEAVQRQFQPVLDDYIAGRIEGTDVFRATDWERRWYWSFENYAPIFRICRECGAKLVALDCDSEDKAKVEVGGLAALDSATLLRYMPDRAGFERFGSTDAFDEYVAYTLRPPFTLMEKLGRRMTVSTDAETMMPFSRFLARQSLRDEAMASASAAWLNQNPGGLLLGLVGLQHVKFSCGVPARTARMLPDGIDAVASVLLNPTPANTFTDPSNLRLCDGTAVANEACLRNDIEVQNYVLQLRYTAGQGVPVNEAVSAAQARASSTVLALSDFLVFSRPS